MTYILHNANGAITGLVAGPGKEYGATLDEHGEHQWLFIEGDAKININGKYVDVEKKATGAPHNECMCEKQSITLECAKPNFNADGIDEAVISGIPPGATVTIGMVGMSPVINTVNDGTVEISSPVPATYVVTVDHIKFLTATITVTAS